MNKFLSQILRIFCNKLISIFNKVTKKNFMAEEVKKEETNSESLSGTFEIEDKKAIVHNAICNKCNTNGWIRSMDHNHIQQGEHLNSRFFRTVQGVFCEKCCPVKG